MAKKDEITLKILQDDFSQILEFFRREAKLSRHELADRDELERYWSEIIETKKGKPMTRVLWNHCRIQKYVCTLAILRTSLKSAKRLCMRFNGGKLPVRPQVLKLRKRLRPEVLGQ